MVHISRKFHEQLSSLAGVPIRCSFALECSGSLPRFSRLSCRCAATKRNHPLGLIRATLRPPQIAHHRHTTTDPTNWSLRRVLMITNCYDNLPAASFCNDGLLWRIELVIRVQFHPPICLTLSVVSEVTISIKHWKGHVWKQLEGYYTYMFSSEG